MIGCQEGIDRVSFIQRHDQAFFDFAPRNGEPITLDWYYMPPKMPRIALTRKLMMIAQTTTAAV
jgi:hypothetical protein